MPDEDWGVRGQRDARERAERLLDSTSLFDELGLDQLAASARMVARDCLEALAMVDAERSARRALQERCERLQAIVGKATYQAALAESTL